MPQKLYLVCLVSAFRSPTTLGIHSNFTPSPEVACTTRDAAERLALTLVPHINPFHCEEIFEHDTGFSWLSPEIKGDIEYSISYETLNQAVVAMGLQPLPLPPSSPPSNPWLLTQDWADYWASIGAQIPWWAIWWEENASTMTDKQKRTIWDLMTDGNPYEIIEVELED
jgi:hypothetical protein